MSDRPEFPTPGTIAESAAALRSGEITACALLAEVLERADLVDPVLGAFLEREHNGARAAAMRADLDFERGIDRSPLQGIPLGVKGIIAVEGIETTAQSMAMSRGYFNGRDAPAVRRLRNAGAVIVGTMTTMEFAIGMPAPEDSFPAPRNPFDLSRWAGGSSSGSASGVAAGMVLGSLGSDTGGSIRLPAAWCGVTGLKPTFGLVPTAGVVPLAYTHDVLGPIARTAYDCALMLTALVGDRSHDPRSAEPPAVDYLPGGSTAPARIGVPVDLIDRAACSPGVTELFDAALEVLRAQGHVLVSVHLPLFDEMQIANDVSKVTEAWNYHRENLTKRWKDYGASARATIMRGALTTGNDYVQAQRVRRAGTDGLRTVFADVDVVATPTSPTTAPTIFGIGHSQLLTSVLTPYWSACGFPALSIPMGLTGEGLPAGLQLAGLPFTERELLDLAHRFQLATDHHRHRPPLTVKSGAA